MQHLSRNKQTVRCAIYTRKSVDEGLDAAYTSLDAQRQFCEDYIARQEMLGWVVLPERYDDGGYTGANMKRPAMQRLLADVDAGKIDVIVVYKVDRLSRSLVDFANLSARLEQKGVSFVLVTQNVDTTTTMGRMQLNLLMTFAQYEREMSSDRVRDKINSMRSKGMWTGGSIPYGYVVENRQLIKSPTEAPIVERIFNSYLETGSPLFVARALNKDGVPRRGSTTLWTTQRVNNILRAPIYRGLVRCGDKLCEGQHEAIISQEVWEKTQQLMKIKFVRPAKGCEETPVLTHVLYCASCKEQMFHSAHRKRGKVYRYYTCRTKTSGDIESDRCQLNRVPAKQLEHIVLDTIREKLMEPNILAEVAAKMNNEDAHKIQRHLKDNEDFISNLSQMELQQVVALVVKRVEFSPTNVVVTFNGDVLLNECETQDPVKTVPIQLQRCSSSLHLHVGTKPHRVELAQSVVPVLTAIKTARKWRELVATGKVRSIYELANKLGYDRRHVSRRFRLAFLSPRIILAIMRHQANLDVSIAKLEDVAHLSWKAQEAKLGVM